MLLSKNNSAIVPGNSYVTDPHTRYAEFAISSAGIVSTGTTTGNVNAWLPFAGNVASGERRAVFTSCPSTAIEYRISYSGSGSEFPFSPTTVTRSVVASGVESVIAMSVTVNRGAF